MLHDEKLGRERGREKLTDPAPLKAILLPKLNVWNPPLFFIGTEFGSVSVVARLRGRKKYRLTGNKKRSKRLKQHIGSRRKATLRNKRVSTRKPLKLSSVFLFSYWRERVGGKGESKKGNWWEPLRRERRRELGRDFRGRHL